MCGIIGYVGEREVASILIEGLKKLEYRGYDSAGIALWEDRRKCVVRVRALGKIDELVRQVSETEILGSIGIGHTRWATHGAPSEMNAHPHKSGHFTIVHNGIIENSFELRKKLEAKGHVFESETDTEVIVKLADMYWREGADVEDAIRKALACIRGTYAVVFLCENFPDTLFACRYESPLVLGVGDDGIYIASDVPAIAQFTKKVVYLEDGDFVVMRRDGFRITDGNGSVVYRRVDTIEWNPILAEKGTYRHFMQKEIFEQPRAISDTVKPYVNFESGEVILPYATYLKDVFRDVSRIVFTACGTSYHAAMVGKYLFESILRIPCDVDLSSEFRYRNPLLDRKTLVIGISQSGETADTKGAISLAKGEGCPTCSIVNVVGSSLSRMTDAVVYTHAGPEIGVASTKTFTTQLAALVLMALFASSVRSSTRSEVYCEIASELLKIPGLMEQVLQSSNVIQNWAGDINNAQSTLYLGRHVLYPIALEGALKLKEISYIHAEGYAAGEMKHGPIALVDDYMPIICLLQNGTVAEKMKNNMEEVQSRGGRIFLCADERVLYDSSHYNINVFKIPASHTLLNPMLFVMPLQLLAYYVAVEKGTDVDQPRNLAKSVTVE